MPRAHCWHSETIDHALTIEARFHQLARLACGLHIVSLLSCVVVGYLYLTTNKRRRTRTSKLLFFLSLCSAMLALITALTEWATAEDCLGVQRCRSDPTAWKAVMESARILSLHTCGAWTGCIAIHLIREQLFSSANPRCWVLRLKKQSPKPRSVQHPAFRVGGCYEKLNSSTPLPTCLASKSGA